jgi:drug/metabolite transporter (DMT)-like permease
MHAAWNALIKERGDRFLTISTLGVAQGLIALAISPFVAFPAAHSWAWIAASAALHVGYKLFLIRAYSAGDLGQVYPLARGSAPLLSSFVAFALLHETMSPFIWFGVIVLCLGIGLMSAKGGAIAHLDRKAVGYALATSVFIAGYTLVDALGARGAASPSSYIVWMFALDGFTMGVIYFAVRRRKGASALLRELPFGSIAAAISIGAYWLIIWAMTRAPIGAVAALRESSILFALAISVIVLRERASRWRLASAGLILAGVILMRVA